MLPLSRRGACGRGGCGGVMGARGSLDMLPDSPALTGPLPPACASSSCLLLGCPSHTSVSTRCETCLTTTSAPGHCTIGSSGWYPPSAGGGGGWPYRPGWSSELCPGEGTQVLPPPSSPSASWGQ